MQWRPTSASEFWAAVSAMATVLAVIAAGVYALLTYKTLKVTRAMLEREDKPLLRLSAVKPGAPPTVVNVGKGVAFTSVVLAADKNLIRFFWTVRGGERAEASGIEFKTAETYLLYCQDIAGRWHLTRATPEEHRTHNRFVGVVKTSSVPDIVRREAQVDSD